MDSNLFSELLAGAFLPLWLALAFASALLLLAGAMVAAGVASIVAQDSDG